MTNRFQPTTPAKAAFAHRNVRCRPPAAQAVAISSTTIFAKTRPRTGPIVKKDWISGFFSTPPNLRVTTVVARSAACRRTKTKKSLILRALFQ